MKIRLIKFWKRPAHVGYANGFHVRWGPSANDIRVLWQWSISVSIKLRFHELVFGFRLYKPARDWKYSLEE